MPAACKNRGNIVYVGFITRALAPALVDWIVRGVQPPASNFPTIASGLLAHSSSRAAVGFPNLHAIGAEYTDTYIFLYQTDYSVIPPQIDPTRQYQVLVPTPILRAPKPMIAGSGLHACRRRRHHGASGRGDRALALIGVVGVVIARELAPVRRPVD